MCKEIKTKLLLYMIIMAISFPYLVLAENAGISVLIFSVIQFICLWFIVPDKRKLILYIPIFIMSLNSFISAGNIWLIPNFILSLALNCLIFMDFNIKKDSLDFVPDMLAYVTAPFFYFNVPYDWLSKITNKKAPVLKRIVLALVIAIPCSIVLIMVLSNADMVFSAKTNDIFDNLLDLLNKEVLVKIIIGISVSLFMFGAVYNAYKQEINSKASLPHFKGDIMVINIVLSVILVIYTLFVIVQFKYLFAGKALPAGFTYTQYARKGFFELLALTGVNIAVILTVIKLTKQHSGKWLLLCKMLCHYLCAVTVILLVSSYFRMNLYIIDDGLTRLRLFVIIFLGFETIGLLITFLYIAKPKFNLALIYFILALTYYSTPNLMPTDYIIAKNQVSKFLNATRNDIEYVFTLSADAAPALMELKENTDDEILSGIIDRFFKDAIASIKSDSWRSYNLSIENTKEFIVK